MSISILRVKDAEGNIIEIPAIKGDKGDKGDAYILTEADKEEISNMAKPDIDQTYSPESENAQSGKAVAEAVGSVVLADVTLDETTGNVKSVQIGVDKEKADACSEYLFEIEFTIDVDYVSPSIMVCLRTGWANNVLSYTYGSKTYRAGTTLRNYSFTLRDGKTMYSICRGFSGSDAFNSTDTPVTLTSFTYNTEADRRSLDVWFGSDNTFPVGTHIRLVGRR